jgi:hypothetical protein
MKEEKGRERVACGGKETRCVHNKFPTTARQGPKLIPPKQVHICVVCTYVCTYKPKQRGLGRGWRNQSNIKISFSNGFPISKVLSLLLEWNEVFIKYGLVLSPHWYPIIYITSHSPSSAWWYGMGDCLNQNQKPRQKERERREKWRDEGKNPACHQRLQLTLIERHLKEKRWHWSFHIFSLAEDDDMVYAYTYILLNCLSNITLLGYVISYECLSPPYLLYSQKCFRPSEIIRRRRKAQVNWNSCTTLGGLSSHQEK